MKNISKSKIRRVHIGSFNREEKCENEKKKKKKEEEERDKRNK